MVILILLDIVLFAIVWLSIHSNIELNEKLDAANNAVDLHKKDAEVWQTESKRIQKQRDVLQEENEKLQRAASRLVMQVAESFGREVTNPKKGA